MIAYEIPTLTCECSNILMSMGQTRYGGRIVFLCGNKDCRFYHKPYTLKPIEHKLEGV